MGFPRQEYCSGLPFSSPRDLPDPGIDRTHVSCIAGILYHWATRDSMLINSNFLSSPHSSLSQTSADSSCGWLPKLSSSRRRLLILLRGPEHAPYAAFPISKEHTSIPAVAQVRNLGIGSVVSFSSSSASLHLLGFVASVSRLCLEAIYFSPCLLLLQ